ncbi:putative lipid-binding transport protein (Tim44 family) [Microbacterium marinum]|uniref:Putative lipid-binding transport protein (Tim44 family) n=1 Tax=Microbacterium marinum TaxID=421115 RepID=A0A7W7BV19_9MICO|nr:hypothetical protein [Microbacterium marinum]MBB4668134.1 putative lipid-binding transport protein (Tim44 family) [Microbacterium marinum]
MTGSQKWGGLVMGILFALIGLLLGSSFAGLVLIIGGAIIAAVHAGLLLLARRKR